MTDNMGNLDKSKKVPGQKGGKPAGKKMPSKGGKGGKGKKAAC